MKKVIAAAAVAVGVLAISVPAHAATSGTQTVTANIANTISMDTAPSSSIANWTLAATGANTTAGGSVVVTSNGPYTVTVTGDKSRLTEYDTNGAAYVASSPKTLTTALSVIGTRTVGTGTAATAVVGTSSTLATGLGLGSDTYTLQLSQPTAITDASLPSGYTYRIVLTYQATSTL
ncbi:MAG: hypothetical protein LC663_05330 [Actinobacteria bacterium]|nr:hypothetical protein [Actinomycetota bacterium]